MEGDYHSTLVYISCMKKAKELGLSLHVESRGYALYKKEHLMGFFKSADEVMHYLCGYCTGFDAGMLSKQT